MGKAFSFPPCISLYKPFFSIYVTLLLPEKENTTNLEQAAQHFRLNKQACTAL